MLLSHIPANMVARSAYFTFIIVIVSVLDMLLVAVVIVRNWLISFFALLYL